ncbi:MULTISPECIES: TROVE domain-containing protein [unclassified Chelatococcus]|uniref:vWA domain-containing protein n=1 Tax=unclassified Chelatococcus TaxID=2638111 RepID=UPI001BCB338A|nr:MULTISPECIES: TROVE domain-containing protein [unclassified Chelatococcus]CAH1673017.1 RNA-binding protein [Hyphomicrobiales bacterium]MBS7738877.1 TROVE domain-containing protein [Chelatococcus sp. HY11]MBX3547029.1 TROVE domain-containing protein [Chelatococcus sp.]MCO5076595.1 TROVE domain-containing protein [Chelatococcus sp.]CAH1674744.1 RNA-binding protein [Hyphomicrobiales bacterium]
MANKSVFATIVGKLIPQTDCVNHEGARAYALTPHQALAQLAATGTFNTTFYAEPREQLDEVLKLAWQVEPEFVAKTAVYAFERGFMKDMPALLLAALSMMPGPEFSRAFPRIVRNGKMVRNFVQVMRSGVTGRKSLGSRPKRLVQGWLEQADDIEIMRAAVGNDPSLADIIKMVHPKPSSASREALYGYLIGRPYDVLAVPDVVKAFEAFKRDPSLPVPPVPFQMLTAMPLSKAHWVEIADKAGWQMLRQNLNTFARHGVFEAEGFTERLAGRLADADEVRRARVFPYQLMVAFTMVETGVPVAIKDALQDAMEIALANVPEIEGNVVVCPDVSGSMRSPATGYRQGATSTVRCVDVATLVAAALLRANRTARVLPFEQDVVAIDLNPRDTVMTNAAKLAAIGGGGTNCSAPLQRLADEKAKVDLVVFVSDNQSWVDGVSHSHHGTATMQAWNRIKVRNPAAKLVCIDIQPNTTTQAKGRADILNVGGFSDQVFTLVAAMARSGQDRDHWVKTIDAIEL